jgi:pimeloyl-ACP methyl ester carboxylesterase
MAVLPLVRVGAGAPVLLVHGSAADHTTWSIQLHARSALAQRFELIAYDRRAGAVSIEQHADDAAAICASLGRDVVAVGSSFGAVVALELIRRHASFVRGAVLCEPPLAASDAEAPIPDTFLAQFDAIAARDGGLAAGEYFLRQVLGDVAYQRMPRTYQARSKAMWRQIRDDSAALGGYRVRYAQLREVATPCLLLGGDRSAASFRPTIEALAGALGHARLEILAGAGHMMQAEAPRAFADSVIRFCAEVHHG